METSLTNYLEQLNEDQEILTEGFWLTAFLGYILIIVIMGLVVSADQKKVLMIVKEILPKVKRDIEKQHKMALPKVLTISRQLFSALTKIKGPEQEVLKTYAFYLWSDKKKPISTELSKVLLNRKKVSDTFGKFLEATVKQTIEKTRTERKRPSIRVIFYTTFFTAFDLHAIDDSWDALPLNITQKYSDDQINKMFIKIDKIIYAHDKKVIALCDDLFKKIEKLVKDFLDKYPI